MPGTWRNLNTAKVAKLVAGTNEQTMYVNDDPFLGDVEEDEFIIDDE